MFPYIHVPRTGDMVLGVAAVSSAFCADYTEDRAPRGQETRTVWARGQLCRLSVSSVLKAFGLTCRTGYWELWLL